MHTVSRHALRHGERIRVLVVDDSAVIRRLVSNCLQQDVEIEVVGSAANGSIALQRIPQYNPHVLTLDVEMPEMNGLDTLRHIRRDYPNLRVIMCSTLTQRGAEVTLEALALGADDYVTKASSQGSLEQSLTHLRQELIPKIKQFFLLPSPTPETHTLHGPHLPPMPARFNTLARSAAPLAPLAVVIGASTGGPTALGSVLPQFPRNFPLPVLVVQHMPPLFTRLLAERLHASCQLPVKQPSDGDHVKPGEILIAPGDYHLKLTDGPGGVCVRLDQSPLQNSCRPSVDALFASAGEIYGGRVVAAVLTGMGQDGLHGAEVLKAQGATILAQDEASSVVWGMPGAIVRAGLADRVLRLEQVAAEIVARATLPNRGLPYAS